MLKEVTIHKIDKEIQPKFMKQPDRIFYSRDGGPQREWEMRTGNGTVHILINKTDSGEVLLAKQVRPPVLVQYPETKGICTEVCAGMIDKYPDMNPILRVLTISKEEVHEEMGYDVAIENLDPLPTYLSNVGMSGSTCYPFYCEVTDADYVGQALTPSEDIEVLAIKYTDLPEWLNTCLTTDATTRQLVQWFIINKLLTPCSK